MKTYAEYLAEQTTARTKAEEQAVLYNEAVANQTGNITSITDKVSEYTADYNRIARTLRHLDCCNADDPIKYAAINIKYPTIGAKVTKDKETGTTTMTIENRTKDIDLIELDKFSVKEFGKHVCVESDWLHHMQALNCLLTANQMRRLRKSRVSEDWNSNGKPKQGGDPNLSVMLKELYDSYNMTEIAKAIDFGKNPLSNTNIFNTVQNVMDKMAGKDVFKVRVQDVNYMLDVYAKKGKGACKVAVQDHKGFASVFLNMMHSKFADVDYAVESKEIKDK